MLGTTHTRAGSANLVCVCVCVCVQFCELCIYSGKLPEGGFQEECQCMKNALLMCVCVCVRVTLPLCEISSVYVLC